MLDKSGRETLLRRAWILAPELAPQIEELVREVETSNTVHESRLRILRACVAPASNVEQGNHFVALEVPQRTFRRVLGRMVALAERDMA